MSRWSTGYTSTRDQRGRQGNRSTFEPALAQLEEERQAAVACSDEVRITVLDQQRDELLERMYPGLSKMSPCSNCNRRGHEIQNCPRPCEGQRRWRARQPTYQDPLCDDGQKSASMDILQASCGRAIWLLGSRCIEFSLASGSVNAFDLPINVKSGSRALGNPACPGEVFVLENGSSKLWLLKFDKGVQAAELTDSDTAFQFRSSLGSRLVMCTFTATCAALLMTGTPGNGAHTPWMFDLQMRRWKKLPDAPYPILSSAVIVGINSVSIVGGWSKAWSCHGYVQTLKRDSAGSYSWELPDLQPLPWRRPGAGVSVCGQMVVALGWMECLGQVGTSGFRLLKRNGASQRAQTSSSRLCILNPPGGQSVAEIACLPFADSFEHNGELYVMGDRVVCIGRDHIQVFDLPKRSWQTMRLPEELCNDRSNSWVKHCGSWALAWIA